MPADQRPGLSAFKLRRTPGKKAEGEAAIGEEANQQQRAAFRVNRKGMHRGEDTGADQERAEDREKESEHGKKGRPGCEALLLFGNDHRVEQCRADQPGHQRRIFDRVPEPPATPAEFVIGPVGSERDAEGERREGGERPDARLFRPDAVNPSFHQAGRGEREDEGVSDIAEVEHGRVDRECRVLQQRIEFCALERGRVEPQVRRRGKQKVGKRARRKQALNAECARFEQVASRAHHCCGRGAETKCYEAPERHRPFMVPPGSGDLVDHRLQRVGIVGNERDGEIGCDEGVDDREERKGHHEEGSDSHKPGQPPFAAQTQHTLRQ